jgi:PAS domain S-box-containing protein
MIEILPNLKNTATSTYSGYAGMKKTTPHTQSYFCPVTCLPVKKLDPWHDSENAPDLKVHYHIIGEPILYIAPSGTATPRGIESAARHTQRIIDTVTRKSGSLVVIYDLIGLENTAFEAREYLIRHFSPDERMASLIFCNVKPLVKICINIGQRLNAPDGKIRIAEQYFTAATLAQHICIKQKISTGPYALGPDISFDPYRPTLTPVAMSDCGAWIIQRGQFSNKFSIIDRRILYSKAKGYLGPADVAHIDRMRETIRAAMPAKTMFEYLLVDTTHLIGGDQQARQDYIRSLNQWHVKHPIRMYILVGTNAAIRTAAYVARTQLDFPIEVVRDLDQAFCLIRLHSQKHSLKTGDNASKSEPLAITRNNIEALLAYIGSVNWEQKGINDGLQLEHNHPLRDIVAAIKILKLELDDLLFERKNAEMKYRELFEKGSDWICFHDLEGNLLETNLAFKTEMGLPSISTANANLKDYIPERYWDELAIYLKNIQRKGHDKGVVRMRCDDDRDIFLEYNNVLINDPAGGPPRVKGMARDITNKIKTAREKKSLQKKLRQAQKMESIGTLAGGIAHDFNNILSSILGFTELAIKDVPKGSLLEDNLLEALKASGRAKDLVNQILAFARQSDHQLEPIQVSLIAKEVLKLLRSTIPASIHIKQKITSESQIMGHPVQVHQIFMNLCTNAAHAMEDTGGIMEIRIEDADLGAPPCQAYPELKPGSFLKITVSDNGKGIGPDVIESIFEPYFTTKAQGRGTGLGLATVHGIVKGYGGEITVDSTPGSGAVFTILLPVVKRPGRSDTDRYEQLPTGTERILFIDDEISIGKMAARVLDGLGYHVTQLIDSKKALELFRTQPDAFDLVVTDLAMPNLTGDKLSVELMKIRPEIPVILITGFSENISPKRVADLGIKALTHKPVVHDNLAKTVRKVLDDAWAGTGS